MKFGKYADFTVGELIALHKTMYLRWCYYNCDLISFNEDILREIYIREEHQIIKPGKAPEMVDIVNDNIRGSKKQIEGYVYKKRLKAKRERLKAFRNMGYRNVPSKSQLQRKNHGKK